MYLGNCRDLGHRVTAFWSADARLDPSHLDSHKSLDTWFLDCASVSASNSHIPSYSCTGMTYDTQDDWSSWLPAFGGEDDAVPDEPRQRGLTDIDDGITRITQESQNVVFDPKQVGWGARESVWSCAGAGVQGCTFRDRR